MKFKVDENLPVEVAELLRQAGHDATTVREEGLGGKGDDEIASVCQQEERIIVTLDTGFADIRMYPPRNYAGLIVLRLNRQDKPYLLDVLSRLLPVFSQETPQRRLWIVEERRIRIRK